MAMTDKPLSLSVFYVLHTLGSVETRRQAIDHTHSTHLWSIVQEALATLSSVRPALRML